MTVQTHGKHTPQKHMGKRGQEEGVGLRLEGNLTEVQGIRNTKSRRI